MNECVCVMTVYELSDKEAGMRIWSAGVVYARGRMRIMMKNAI